MKLYRQFIQILKENFTLHSIIFQNLINFLKQCLKYKEFFLIMSFVILKIFLYDKMNDVK